MGFSRQEYCRGLSCPPPGIFPTHGLNPHSYVSRIGKWVLYHHLTSPIRYHYCHPLEKAMAPHSSPLAGKIPWAEEPDRLQSMGARRVGHDWATSLSLFTFMHWRRKWHPRPVFLPGESQGRGAWWAAVYGVAQGRTRLKRLSSSSSVIHVSQIRDLTEMWTNFQDHGANGLIPQLVMEWLGPRAIWLQTVCC